MILWTGTMPFWQPNYFFDRRPMTCRKLSESDEFFLTMKKFFKIFVLTARIPFWRLGRKIFDIKPQICLWMPKIMKLRLKKYFHQKGFDGQVEYCFDNPNYFFWQEAEDLSLNVSKVMNYFLTILNFFLIFVLTTRIQFWRLNGNTCDKKPQFFPWMPKMIELCLKKTFSSKCFDGHVRYCFDNPTEIFQKKPKRFSSMSWKDGKQ